MTFIIKNENSIESPANGKLYLMKLSFRLDKAGCNYTIESLSVDLFEKEIAGILYIETKKGLLKKSFCSP